MSRLDFCINQLVNECYDWKNDNCDKCNIFKAYCEGERRAKNSIVRCKDCRYCVNYTDGYRECRLLKNLKTVPGTYVLVDGNDYCSHGERREE